MPPMMAAFAAQSASTSFVDRATFRISGKVPIRVNV